MLRLGASRRSFSSASSATVANAPSLRDFLRKNSPALDSADDDVLPPYLSSQQLDGAGRGVYIETYGCQMNVADTEVVHSVLQGSGYVQASEFSDADVVLLNTCAIRENAESKIWGRLREIRAAKRRAAEGWRKRGERAPPSGPVVGILGCMGERLKGKLLETERLVDVVCGPDAYRSLPRLLAQAESGQPSLDVALSLDETYADVAPVRANSDGISAFVSIMRGCNNMCSYCIVPHTRGRERSRPVSSIAAEVARLAADGYREVTLLGQNVNSYADGALPAGRKGRGASEQHGGEGGEGGGEYRLREGFTPMVPPPQARVRFAGLLDTLAAAHPEVRFRFTSPHPKDFPDELLEVIRERPNACASLHIPAQSGSTSVLQAMRRGYSRETYLRLIDRVREVLPDVSLSSDFISGFCGETDDDHRQTLSLLRQVRFDKAFMFAYSMREKTHAHRRLDDDVPESVKQGRLREVIDEFNVGAREANEEDVGKEHLVLVEGLSRKSDREWVGRTDTNKRVVLERTAVATVDGATRAEQPPAEERRVDLRPGDFAAVRVTAALSANTLRATPLARSSISSFGERAWASA
jgi:tRNA A37 methylthiotransferase MiaB